jgi:hypothetical protein
MEELLSDMEARKQFAKNIIIVSCSRILKIISAHTKVSETNRFAFLGNVGF